MSEDPRYSVEAPENKGDRKASVVVKPVDLDDVLTNELGQFGWFQLRNILLVAVPIMMSAFMSEYIFSAAAIPHRYLHRYFLQSTNCRLSAFSPDE